MANTSAPFGFTPYSNQSGAAPNYQQVKRLCPSTAASMFTGDPVASQSDGSIARGTVGANAIAGIFVGCEYLSVSQKRQVWSPYWPGSDLAVGQFATCYVISDPNALFRVQSTGSAAVGFADINANIDWLLGTGNTSTGQSGASANQANISPSTVYAFRVVDLVQDPPGVNGTDATSANNQIVVAFNNVDSRITAGT